jgi:integrase
MQLSIPYLKLRGGRPRWEPGPHLRQAGFKGRDLKDQSGDWLADDAAIAAARILNDEVTTWRTGKQRRRTPAPVAHARSCNRLWEAWQTSPKYQRLARGTRLDYAVKIKPFLAEFGEAPVAAIGKHNIYAWWQELYRDRGHAMANGIVAVVRSMLSHASRLGWITTNPARELGLETVAPRLVLWLPAEISALVASADSLGWPSIGDGIIIALHSGQRISDVLALPSRIFEANRIRLTQAKTAAMVDAPMTPALRSRVATMRARQTTAQAGLTVVDLNRPLILSEQGEAYQRSWFSQQFAKVRAHAAKTSGQPDILNKNVQDLRDTAVTRLALAECDLVQISAITGHSIQSIPQILKHYLVMQPAMADAAISKLSNWLEKEGIAI